MADINNEIIDYLKTNYNLLISEAAAEEVNLALLGGSPLIKNDPLELKGRDAATGVPMVIAISLEDMRKRTG